MFIYFVMPVIVSMILYVTLWFIKNKILRIIIIIFVTINPAIYCFFAADNWLSILIAIIQYFVLCIFILIYASINIIIKRHNIKKLKNK